MLPRLLAVAFVALMMSSCGSSEPPIEELPADDPQPPPPPPDEPVASPPPPPQPEPPPEPPPPPPPRVVNADEAFQGLTPAPAAAWLTCAADTDCAVVEVGCCDHCNGGRVVSVKTRQANAAQRRYRPRRCPDACTELGCAAAEPVCLEGRCGFRAPWMAGEAAAAPAPAAPAEPPASP